MHLSFSSRRVRSRSRLSESSHCLKGICGFSPLFLNATGPRPSPTEFCLVCRQREEQVRDADAWVHRTQTFRATTVRRTRVRTCCFRQERYDSPPIERSSRYADGKCPHGDCPRCPLLPGVTTWGLSPLLGVEIGCSLNVRDAAHSVSRRAEISVARGPHGDCPRCPALKLPIRGLSPLPVRAK